MAVNTMEKDKADKKECVYVHCVCMYICMCRYMCVWCWSG